MFLMSCNTLKTPISDYEVILSPDEVEMEVGDSISLIATFYPDNSVDKKLCWYSDDENIAYVNEQGKVYALSVGDAIISVSTQENESYSTAYIKVIDKRIPVFGLELDKTSITMMIGDESELIATVFPEDASNKNVIWSSSDEDVSSVINGVVKALKSGRSIITAKTEDGGKIRKCVVVVTDELLDIELNKSKLVLTPNSSYQLVAKLIPDNSPNESLKWYSNNTRIATVDETGLVTAIADGMTQITVYSDNGIEATCDLTVCSSTREELLDYVDDFGVNHGKGIQIYSVIWAPVNCGYQKASENGDKGFEWGLLYQWGRKFGQGYSDFYDIDVIIKEGPVTLDVGQNVGNKDVFFTSNVSPYNWLNNQDVLLWNTVVNGHPVKTDFDPCPSGWRVPTDEELYDLVANGSELGTNQQGQVGRWFSGIYTYTVESPKIFLPAAGGRNSDGTHIGREQEGFYYASSAQEYFGSSSILFNESSVDIGQTSSACALSVRCVQDTEFID